MFPYRTRFKNDIVAEFLPPKRPSGKVIIFLDGMPSVPSKGRLLEYFSKKNFWVFHPRYRGTWESGGAFLKRSPHEDALDIISELPKGFKDALNGKTFCVRPKSIYIFGVSFGGAAALLSTEDPRVTKAVALSPVVSWKARSKSEPVEWMGKWVRRAFGNGYRYTEKNWQKLGRGSFYDPLEAASRLDGRKILIVHAKDDDTVPWKPAAAFSKISGAELILKKHGGHFSSSDFMRKPFYRAVMKFLKSDN